MNTQRLLGIALAALLACGGTSGAAEPPAKPQAPAKAPASKAPASATAPTPPSVFAKLDGDRDDRISEVESRESALLEKAFANLDTNRDGFLTSTEFAMWEEAGNLAVVAPADPALQPSGSRGAQHMPERDGGT